MRAHATSLMVVGLLAWAPLGCNLLVSFDPDGLPCESGRCLPGYGCVGGRCVLGRGLDSCGGCSSGDICADGVCVPDGCAYRRCPVGHGCQEVEGVVRCQPLSAPALGGQCQSDAECSAGAAGRV